jgi:hypothetical protein
MGCLIRSVPVRRAEPVRWYSVQTFTINCPKPDPMSAGTKTGAIADKGRHPFATESKAAAYSAGLEAGVGLAGAEQRMGCGSINAMQQRQCGSSPAYCLTRRMPCLLPAGWEPKGVFHGSQRKSRPDPRNWEQSVDAGMYVPVTCTMKEECMHSQTDRKRTAHWP